MKIENKSMRASRHLSIRQLTVQVSKLPLGALLSECHISAPRSSCGVGGNTGNTRINIRVVLARSRC